MLVQLVTRTGTPPLALIEPDPNAWNHFANQPNHGHLLQSAAWAEIKRTTGWQVRRIAALTNGRVQAGAQILIKRRFGVSAVYIPRGPILSGDDHIDRALFAAIGKLARHERAVFIRVEPNTLESVPHAGELHSWLLLNGYNPTEPLQPRSTIHLDLHAQPEKLLAAMSKGHRADIKRATRDGVTVRSGRNPADLAAFYAILQSTSQRANFGIHELAYYTSVLQRLGRRAQLWLAEKDGVPHATAITALGAGTALYLYSGSTEAGLRSGAQHAIQWAAIQWAVAAGAHTYDFWGIPDQFGQMLSANSGHDALDEAAKADPLYGVYRFKKGFGGRVVRYLPAYDRVLIAPAYRLLRNRL